LKKAVFDSSERKRLYKEARRFLQVRSMRNKLVKQKSRTPGSKGTPEQPQVPNSSPQEPVQV